MVTAYFRWCSNCKRWMLFQVPTVCTNPLWNSTINNHGKSFFCVQPQAQNCWIYCNQPSTCYLEQKMNTLVWFSISKFVIPLNFTWQRICIFVSSIFYFQTLHHPWFCDLFLFLFALLIPSVFWSIFFFLCNKKYNGILFRNICNTKYYVFLSCSLVSFYYICSTIVSNSI